MTEPAPILSFVIDCPRSGNHSVRQHWAVRRRGRRSIYEHCRVAIEQDPRWRAAVLHKLEDPQRRRFVFTRGVGMVENAPTAKRRGSHPTHVLDVDNMAQALKPVVDCCLMDRPRRPGLSFAWDDSPSMLSVEYRQDASVEPGKLRIDIWECEVTP